jgi:hypothetical protein
MTASCATRLTTSMPRATRCSTIRAAIGTGPKCERVTAAARGELKKSAEDFDKRRPVEQQYEGLETYFKQAAALVRSMLDAAAPLT